MKIELASRQDISKAMKRILVREVRVNINPDLIADNEPLNSDRLRISSLSFIGMIMTIEDELDITLDDEQFMKAKFITVADLVNFVYRVYCKTHQEEEVNS